MNRQVWLGYLSALAGVALATALIGQALSAIRLANLSMVYLLVVLGIATTFGSGPAIVASVLAFVSYNWFFVPPVHTFTVADPAEWVALLLFLVTAVITGQLAAGQRRRAQEAEQREHEAIVLYDLVRRLDEPDLQKALMQVVERLQSELQLEAIAIELEAGGGVKARAVAGSEAGRALLQSGGASAQVLGSGPTPTSKDRGAPGRWIRVVPPHRTEGTADGRRLRRHTVPVQIHERRAGAIHLALAPGATRFGGAQNRLLSAVAAQLALVLERARLREEATEAEILRRTDELKSALLSAVSHDLRTPLASIIAAAGSLRQEDVAWTRAERRQFATDIEAEAQRLNRIVQNLLDLSRIQAGYLQPERGWYDFAALVEDVAGRLRPLTAGHRVRVEVPNGLPPAYVDYVEIDQVLSNLIENAVRHTPAGTEIRIAVQRIDGELQVTVADRGPGIPPAALPHLFEPFFRAGAHGVRRSGTGVGLAVARGLVEAHGGRLWAENAPEGGARFVFTLPLAETPSAPVANGR